MNKSLLSYKIKHYIVSYSICLVFALVIIIPILVAILGGFKSQGQMRIDPFGIPSPVHFEYYLDILTNLKYNFWLFMSNSLIVLAISVILDITLSTMAAYALAWIPFKGSKIVFTYFLIGFLFPGSVAMLPLYLELKAMNLIDTHWAVILVQAGFGLPWHIMLLRGFFVNIPSDLHDACAIDGCGPIRFLLNMVIPLSTPVIATASVLAIVGSWNNFFLPLMFLNSQELYTLPLGVMQFMGQYGMYWNQIMAFLILAMIPAVIFYIFAQKFIIAGLTGGSIKG